MTRQTQTINVAAGMTWSIIAPALAAALVGLVGGPGFAFVAFLYASYIAGAHVIMLALPLYGLFRLLGCSTGPGTALVSAALVGALPATFLFGGGAGFWGGLFGLIGGGAFCAASVVRTGEQ